MTYQPQFPPPAPQVPPPAAPKRPWFRRARVLAPAALLLGVGIGSAGKTGTVDAGAPRVAGTGPTVTATVTAAAKPPAAPVKPAAPAPAAPAGMPDDGTYVVGVDVKPGTYRAPGDELCYWARLKDTNGTLESVLANHVGGGRQVVTIKASDRAFETRGCGAWTRS